MSLKKLISLSIIMGITTALIIPTYVKAASQVSSPISTSNIKIVNDVYGVLDEVQVKNVQAGDIIKVYNNEREEKPIAVTKALGTDAVVYIDQLGVDGGEVFVSITKVSKSESLRTLQSYLSESSLGGPLASNIEVINNYGISDLVTVKDLLIGDKVNVYGIDGVTLLGTATAKINGNLQVKLAKQISSDSIYVSVTEKGKNESKKTLIQVQQEEKTEAIGDLYISVDNIASTSDTVTVRGLNKDETVKIYGETDVLLTTATSKAKGDFVIKVPQGKIPSDGGIIRVSLTSLGLRESDKVEVVVSEEPVTAKLAVKNIVIANNSATSDTITIKALVKGDIIKVYDELGKNVLASEIAKADGDFKITLLRQLSYSRVNVTLTNINKRESEKVDIVVPEEGKTDSLILSNVTAINNTAEYDKIIVKAVKKGDFVKVYSSNNGLVASASAAIDGELIINIAQGKILPEGDVIRLSLTKPYLKESEKLDVVVRAEAISPKVSEANVQVVNNIEIADKVIVKGVMKGTLIKVYDSLGKTVLGSETAATNGDLTIVLSKQIVEGAIQITASNLNSRESEQVEITVPELGLTDALPKEKVMITNNAIGYDVVTIRTLTKGDIIKIYSSDNVLLTNETAKANGDLVLNLIQGYLPYSGGTIKLSKTKPGLQESEKVEMEVYEEASTKMLLNTDIVVSNNVGSSDAVTIKKLIKGDTINVYNTDGKVLLGTATAQVNGDLVVYLSKQITEKFISVTNKNLNSRESEKVLVSVPEEILTNPLVLANVEVRNNSTGYDTVKVKGVVNGDVVKVYSSTDILLITLTASSSGDLTVNIPQGKISSDGDFIKVSLMKKGTRESEKLEIVVGAEEYTTKPLSSNITIVNNVGIADFVTVKGIIKGEVVKVYDELGKTLLGENTAALNGEIKISLYKQLENSKICLSVTSFNKRESNKVEITVPEEGKTIKPVVSDVAVKNNVVGYDVVTINNLKKGIVVKVYNSQGILIATSTATKDGSLTMNILQGKILEDGDMIKVSLTQPYLRESDRLDVVVQPEEISILDGTNITVANNTGMADTVTVASVKKDDVVKVYNAAGNVLLGKATATADGSLKVILSKQFMDSNINVSLTGLNKRESSMVLVTI